MKRLATLTALSVFMFVLGIFTNSWAAAPCNEDFTVGGGITEDSGNPAKSPFPGAGWDVGTGQCNGSFTITANTSFPSDDVDGIELGIRAEQRRVGQVTNTSNNGDYEVETGPDPTQANRAWWNFQHSIAYDGNINDLDSLTFIIRTDAGPSVPNGPFDMLFLRQFIDDRRAPKSTTTYSDLYQTSQNPVFPPWFANFDFDDEGAWTLTLIAEKNGRFASTSICIHTPNAACDPTPGFSTQDHFQCYGLDDATRLNPRPEVSLNDQFGFRDNVQVKKKAHSYCTPVDKNGEGIINPDNTLTCYKIEKGEKESLDIVIKNQFGLQEFELKRSKLLCVPSTQVSVETNDEDEDEDDDDKD